MCSLSRKQYFGLFAAVFCLLMATVPECVDAFGGMSLSTRNISRQINRQVAQTLIPVLSVSKGRAGKVQDFAISPRHDRAIIWTEDQLSLWDLYLGREIKRVNRDYKDNKYYLSADGHTVYSIGRSGDLYHRNLLEKEPVAIRVKSGSKFKTLQSLDDNQWIGITPRKVSIFKQAEDGDLLAIGDLNGFDPSVSYVFSRDGNRYAYYADKKITLSVTKSGKTLWQSSAVGNPKHLSISESGIDVVYPSIVVEMSIRNGAEIKRWSKKGHIADSNLQRIEKSFIALGSNSDLVILDENYRQKCDLFLLENGWAVVDKIGRYDGSGGVSTDVAWVADKYRIEVTSLLATYYDPGLLAKYLTGKREKKDEPNSIYDGISIPPVVRLENISANNSIAKIRITATVNSRSKYAKADKSSVSIYQNGKYVPINFILKKNVAGDGEKIFEWLANVTLANGANDIQGILKVSGNPDVKSNSIRLDYEVKNVTPAFSVTSVGVNKYQNPDLELNYAVNDAKSFMDRIISTTEQKYSEKEKVVLLDVKANFKNIKDMLSALEKTQKEDFVVMYFSGHGVVHDGEWYFLPTESTSLTDKNRVKHSGVSASMLAKAIAKVPAQKVLLIIDACQSGAVLDRFSAFEQQKATAMLSNQIGIHVLTATRADQLAPEYESLGHGLFTYTLLNGLEKYDGYYNADRNPKDGVVTVNELKSYVQEYVPVLAEHLNASGISKGNAGPYVWEPITSGIGVDYAIN